MFECFSGSGIVLGAGDIVVNKTDENLVLKEEDVY